MLDRHIVKQKAKLCVLALAGLALAWCSLHVSGCYRYVAKVYSPPVASRAHRVFDCYVSEIRLANKNASSTYYYTTADEIYEIELRIILDSVLVPGQVPDTGWVVRITDFCMASSCFSSVYCPPIAAESTLDGQVPTEKQPSAYIYNRKYDFGFVRIPDECDSIEIKFDAALVNRPADTLLKTQTVRFFLTRHQWEIQTWMPI